MGSIEIGRQGGWSISPNPGIVRLGGGQNPAHRSYVLTMKLDSQRITWREIDGELVILDLAASTYLTTNETGTTLLKELVEERSHEELVEVLLAAFDVSREAADTDVRAFVEDLDRNGLLSRAAQLERG